MRAMRHPIIRSLLMLALLAAGGWQISSALAPSASPEKEVVTGQLAPERVHQRAAQAIVQQLQNHYRQLRLNDELSSQVLDRFIGDLDPNRIYFRASDIESFENYRHAIDDELRRGDLSIGYKIFNTYQARILNRIEYLLGQLEEGIDELDFSGEQSILIDREQASWAASQDEADDLWRKRLKNAVLAMRLDGLEDEEISERLERRYRGQINRIQQNTAEDAFQFYINALARTFDPHTSYFTPHSSENFNISMSRSLEGIGAVLQSEDEYTRVVRLVPAGPADNAGQLKPADRIVAVGQEDEDLVNVIGWRLDEVVNLIRGPKGSTVRLEIIPAGSASEHATREIEIVRNKVVLEDQAAKKKIITVPGEGRDLNLGVIDIPAFYLDFEAYRSGDPDYTSTTRDVARLLSELQEEDLDGLVIDLRNNGGGSLQEATQLVSLFINQGPTVQVRDYRGRVNVDQDHFPGVLYAGPMAVLVNRFSASASEIFAGAMQDYGRAVVVGDHTYGKGTVQTLLPLNHGQLKITQAKFYRVSGSSNQNLGVVPDVIMPWLVDKEKIGESALPNALPWDQIDATDYEPLFDLSPYLPKLNKLHDQRRDSNPEFVYVRQQLELMQEQQSRDRLSLNEELRRSEQQDMEERQLNIENQRRKALGEELIESLAQLRKLEEQRALDPEFEESEEREDAYLRETGAILGDLISLMEKTRLAGKEG